MTIDFSVKLPVMAITPLVYYQRNVSLPLYISPVGSPSELPRLPQMYALYNRVMADTQPLVQYRASLESYSRPEEPCRKEDEYEVHVSDDQDHHVVSPPVTIKSRGYAAKLCLDEHKSITCKLSLIHN